MWGLADSAGTASHRVNEFLERVNNSLGRVPFILKWINPEPASPTHSPSWLSHSGPHPPAPVTPRPVTEQLGPLLYPRAHCNDPNWPILSVLTLHPLSFLFLCLCLQTGPCASLREPQAMADTVIGQSVFSRAAVSRSVGLTILE